MEESKAGEESIMKVKKRVLQGAVIHKEKPFVYALSSKVRTEYCDYCFKKSISLKLCSGCRYVYYCGKVCQKDGWGVHKFECRNLKRISPRIIPDAARTLARLIKIVEKGGDLVKSYYLENRFRMYRDLMSHYPNIKNDSKRLEHFNTLYQVLQEFLGNDTTIPNTAELMGMYGRMCINSFNIMSADLQCLGTGMYLGASVIDHSCKPNAVAVFEGTTLYIRALETLQFLDWSQIFISYIDILNTTKDRQEELQNLYYFLCACPKCIMPEPEEIDAAACPNKKCDNPLSINKLKPHDVCDKCGETVTEDFWNNLQQVMELTDLHLQNMKQLAYLKLGKILLYEKDINFAMEHLKLSYDILKVTHGTNSCLYREELMPLLHQARIESQMI